MENEEKLELYEACMLSWDELLEALQKSMFTYSLQEIHWYNTDGMDSEMAAQIVPSIIGTGVEVRGSYNDYTSKLLFTENLQKKWSRFEYSFFLYIDCNCYLASDRLKVIRDFIETIQTLKPNLFRLESNLTLHSKTNYEGEGFYEGGFVSKEHHDLIADAASVFVKSQYELFQKLETLITTSLVFLPGRLDVQAPVHGNVLNFNLTRAELTQMLILLREYGIITFIPDAALGKFAETNFLAKYKPLKAIATLISQFNTGGVPNVTAKNAVKAILKNISM